MQDSTLQATQSEASVSRIETWAPLFGLVAIDIILVVWALHSIFVTEMRAKGHRITITTVFTTSNMLLLGIVLTGAATTLSRAFYEMSHRTSAIGLTFNVLFLGLSEMIYLFYSWLRGKEILRVQSSSRVYKLFKYLLCSTIVFCSLPVIVTFFEKSVLVELLFILSEVVVGCCVISLEIYFPIATYFTYVK
ncbi:hypothetical protein BCR33DRAFT_75892 [Rhizoclosmatium globosum]|uniref:Uncharacterized protein n=1 Tax=Rhizoclosmatium globosum TaxID=329046 RepID=A0A1Y2CMQ2_9FUNG|nr:hypothetical protein BCR33DRAFT_75892 [Rhizoclosmatium globosum]|eukprot:ORY47645.1 hypothetical protein BCR33DRAFT_75892 [Rhizoclosmatium globosum]